MDWKTMPLSAKSRPSLEPTHPHIQWVPAIILPRVKWSLREADHRTPSSVDVVNLWSSSTLLHFMERFLITGTIFPFSWQVCYRCLRFKYCHNMWHT